MFKKLKSFVKKTNSFIYRIVFGTFSRFDRIFRKIWTFIFVRVLKKFLLPFVQFAIFFSLIKNQFDTLVAERKIITSFNLYGYWMKKGWLPKPENPNLDYPMKSWDVRKLIHNDPRTLQDIRTIINHGYDKYYSGMWHLLIALSFLAFHEVTIRRHNNRLRATVNEYLTSEFDNKGVVEGKWAAIDSSHYKYSMLDRVFTVFQYTSIFTISTMKLFGWLQYLGHNNFYGFYFINSTAPYWGGVRMLFRFIDPFLLNLIIDRFQFIFITRNRYNVPYMIRYHSSQAFCLDMTLGVLFMIVDYLVTNFGEYLTYETTFYIRFFELTLYFGFLLPIIFTAFLSIETRIPIIHSAVIFHAGKPPKAKVPELWGPLKMHRVHVGTSLNASGRKRDFTFKYKDGIIPTEVFGLIGLIGLINFAFDPLWLTVRNYLILPINVGLRVFS